MWAFLPLVSALFLSHSPLLLPLSHRLTFMEPHLNSSPLRSPSLPYSRKLIHFDDFLITSLPPRSSLHPSPHHSSASQVYINHRGLTWHTKELPFLRSTDLPWNLQAVDSKHHMRLEAIPISYGHARPGYPSMSLYMNVLMNLTYLQTLIEGYTTLQRPVVPLRHSAIS